GDPNQAAALLHVIFERALGWRGDSLHVPVVDDHKLEAFELGGRTRRRLLHLELVGLQDSQQVLFTGFGVVRDQEHAWAAQGDGVLKTRVAESARGQFALYRDGANRVDAGLQPQPVQPPDKLHLARADALAFRRE